MTCEKDSMTSHRQSRKLGNPVLNYLLVSVLAGPNTTNEGFAVRCKQHIFCHRAYDSKLLQDRLIAMNQGLLYCNVTTQDALSIV